MTYASFGPWTASLVFTLAACGAAVAPVVPAHSDGVAAVPTAPPTAPEANVATANAAPIATHTASQTLVLGAGTLVLRGMIARELIPGSEVSPFVAGPGAALHITVRHYIGEDAGAPLVLDVSAPVPPGPVTFPIAYDVLGDPRVLEPAKTYLVSAEMAAASPASAGLRLVSEHRHEIRHGARSVDLTVTGLESCASPGAGGYCY